MKVLFLGDIDAKAGRKAVANVLPVLKDKHEPDITIANAENLAHGMGVTKKTLKEILDAGVDFLTSGNHIWDQKEVYEIFQDSEVPLIRPANYPDGTPGQGYKIVQIGARELLIMNVLGNVFMKEDLESPFKAVDKILEEIKNKNIKLSVLDAHTEATSEINALGWYLDGRVSAVLGTHMHVQTADERILPKGTAYISDVGMTGPRDSILGVDKDAVIEGFLTQRPVKFFSPEIDCKLNAVIVDLDQKSGKAKSINRISEVVEI